VITTPLLNSLLYFPLRTLEGSPREAGLDFEELQLRTSDGERLHGWWIRARRRPALAHVLFFHGNGGNISQRLGTAKLLVDAGFDLLLFDYRGYGLSAGTPSEKGTYRDARAARGALLARDDADPARIIYLGESLGGAVAAELALEHPPLGLVLQSTFTSVRDMARLHYPFIPGFAVPNAYPTLDRIRRLRSPLLVIHGELDDIVPVSHGRALFEAANEPKTLRVVRGAGHNDLVEVAGTGYGSAVANWARTVR
jgi:fermentation-respiration switch protein FrsA (DUF1100 family)